MFYSKKRMKKIYLFRCLYFINYLVLMFIFTLVLMGIAIAFN